MKTFFYKIFLLFLILIIQLSAISFCDDIDNETIDVNAEINCSDNSKQIIKEPETNSRSCIVLDRNSNTVLYGKNENTRKKMASTTKIMTSLIIIENCDLNNITKISKKASSTGGSRLGLKYNDEICIKDLLYGLMLRSGNDSAVALAEYCSGSIEEFAKLMNQKAKDLNLLNTNFETPHGLDSDNHYTTAYELALLSNYALKNEFFADIVKTKNYIIHINKISKEISNTNELLGNFKGIYGIKTGFTNGANRCLVTACKRNNIDVICVVLGADTKKYRTSDTIKLLNYVFTNFESYNVQEFINNNFDIWKKENYGTFNINKGSSQNLNLYLENLTFASIPIRKDILNKLNLQINCKTYIEAPIIKNSQIGILELKANNFLLANCRILNSETITKKNITSYFLLFFKSFQYVFQSNLI